MGVNKTLKQDVQTIKTLIVYTVSYNNFRKGNFGSDRPVYLVDQ